MILTPFNRIHKSLGAKMVEFGGYEMPVQYKGIIEEHLCVRYHVGVFDVSHMGEFEVAGPGAEAFVQKITINDVKALYDGRVQYSALCYEDGGIVDDLLVYRMSDRYMLVVNAANLKKDYHWIMSRLPPTGVTLTDKSESTALLAIQGPQSRDVVQRLTKTDLAPLEYYHFIKGTVAGVPAIISRTGYTGELGYEIYFDAATSTCEAVWNALFDAGKQFSMQPIGLGARDTLRLEAGLCLYGNDIDQTTNPLEAGLGWITKLNKGDFIGRKAILAAKEAGLKRSLTAFTLPGKTIPRHGYEIRANGNVAGAVTSGTYSPVLQCGIGVGYVKKEHHDRGNTLSVVIRGKEEPATVVKLPFIKKT
jgi:aminomethyltransferase